MEFRTLVVRGQLLPDVPDELNHRASAHFFQVDRADSAILPLNHTTLQGLKMGSPSAHSGSKKETRLRFESSTEK